MPNAEFDGGDGSPVVVIPGVQGRWEWMRPALDALAHRCRAISYSLRDVGPASTAALDDFTAQLDAALDRAGIAAAAIAGVSFGGLIAIHYAATRPRRTSSLILASTPSPVWTPSMIQRRYMRRPWMSAPLFAAGSSAALSGEIAAAIPDRLTRLRFYARQAARILTAPEFPGAIATRGKLLVEVDLTDACRRISAPSLVITGESALDRIVPVESTREYLQLIPGAQYAMMEGTGHLGLVTKPELFADLVTNFIDRACHP